MKKLVTVLAMVMVFAFVTTSFAFYQSSSSYNYGTHDVTGNNGHSNATVDDYSHKGNYGNKSKVEITRQNVIDNSTRVKFTDVKYGYSGNFNAAAATTSKTTNFIYGNNGNSNAYIYNSGNGNTNSIKINRTNVIDNSVTNEYIRKK